MNYDELIEYCQNVGLETNNPSLEEISMFLNNMSLNLEIDKITNLYFVYHNG